MAITNLAIFLIRIPSEDFHYNIPLNCFPSPLSPYSNPISRLGLSQIYSLCYLDVMSPEATRHWSAFHLSDISINCSASSRISARVEVHCRVVSSTFNGWQWPFFVVLQLPTEKKLSNNISHMGCISRASTRFSIVAQVTASHLF